MSARPGQLGSVVPAQLSFLAIYNPSLGNTDDTLPDQVVFYWSRKNTTDKRGNDHAEERVESAENKNEMLRRVGLAQGIVEFARSFSEDKAVRSVETEKSRIVLHELEPGWWILASIDLTRLHSNELATHTTKTPSQPTAPQTEYSVREVSPPHLLTEQLRRAHSGFLLHHATSLSELYAQVDRSSFCSYLRRFWNRFVWNWDVLLHGNPSVDVFAAIKLAGGGELGMGVGEEDRGSGEREVFEGFVERIEGLVDLVVSKFGEPLSEGGRDERNTNRDQKEKNQTPKARQWGGPGSLPNPMDGVVFSGVGALTRTSLRDIADWMEELYEHGDNAYGVHDSPTLARRRKQRKPRAKADPTLAGGPDGGAPSHRKQSSHTKHGIAAGEERNNFNPTDNLQHRIPPPIVPTTKPTVLKDSREDGTESQGERGGDSLGYGAGKLMKYLTLGYHSPWSTPPSKPNSDEVGDGPGEQIVEGPDDGNAILAPIQHIEPQPDIEEEQEEVFIQRREKTVGYFLVGLRGDVEDEVDEPIFSEQDTSKGACNGGILVRTVQVELRTTYHKNKGVSSRGSLDQRGSISERPTDDPHKHQKCRVVVYVYPPFIFTFLFEPNTGLLSHPTFYRSLHHQLGPLQRPLLASTSSSVSPAIRTAVRAVTKGTQPIYDLIYDPISLTISSSIPNIPIPALIEGHSVQADVWTRVEALNVHQQVLNIFNSTRHQSFELERTCKTSRGWLIMWMQLPSYRINPVDNDANSSSELPHQRRKEAILVRKARDYSPGNIASLSGHGKDGRGSSNADGVAGLAGGMGFDTKKYIEGLLNLNR
ncbi:hypothetical protein GP486_001292 [Trichoglossum hirsutum]|uniref:CCZ1/INTU/HSP4 first Longin domain-containing protein n=1 Tax=Trichoglossum hirsutum TaxID=265104 RepID=A0A9P8LH60_9PEZI|nr:hypothetical protein GP486_001292 [Trichoglossum hirsutum]